MSTSPLQIAKGTDLTVNMTLYQSDGVTVLDLTGYPYMDIYLYQSHSKQSLEQYSKATHSGYNSITYTNAAAGQISFVITRNATRKAKEGQLFIAIRTTAGTYYYGQSKVFVGEIVEAIGGANEIPT